MGIGVTQCAVLHAVKREREADTSCGVTCYAESKMTLKSIFKFFNDCACSFYDCLFIKRLQGIFVY